MRQSWTLIALPLVCSITQNAIADPCPTRAQWPTGAWTLRVEEVAALRGAEIAALEQLAFTLTGTDAERTGIRTDAVVIVHQGAIFYERYARGWTADQPHFTWSVTKTLTNALTGIAQGAGLLDLNASICHYIRIPREDNCVISPLNLLEFSSGLDWNEVYEDESNQDSSVLAMLYGVGHRNAAMFIASHDRRDEPGTTFMYSSGDTTLLSRVVDSVLRPMYGEEYAWPLLFDRIGIDSATIERDINDGPIGSSFFYATPRDLAKFGFLYLNDGCWEDQRILPENWVLNSTSVSAPFRARPLEIDDDDVQGWQIWLNRPVPEQNITTPWPDVPEDAFAARGHWGQSITVIPSLDLVIVRLADDRNERIDFNEFLSRAIAVVQ
jgi:CubicO group peptidase (beta-lactamase class C family)